MRSPAGLWTLYLQDSASPQQLSIDVPDSQGHFSGTIGDVQIQGIWDLNDHITFLTYPLLPNDFQPWASYAGTIFTNDLFMTGMYNASTLEIIAAQFLQRPTPSPKPWVASRQ